jgi:uroporphyrinogen III methyltransferase/synthase
MTVYLVGAGPGDPGLLTRRGASLLSEADVVLYDRLVHHSVLALAPVSAELIDVGKKPTGSGGGAALQDEINRLLVEHGQRRRTVVRLKGGDPFLFGRGGEEVEALTRAGIRWEVVPGVSSAFGVPAAAGIPVTHRGVSSSVTVVTGRVDDPTPPHGVNWDALAKLDGTLVILMGMMKRAEIAEALIRGGKPASTPLAVIARGTTIDQAVVRTTLGELGEVTLGAPAVIVIGPVATLGATPDSGPGTTPASEPGSRADVTPEVTPTLLSGRTVVVTRSGTRAREMVDALRHAGAETIEVPLTEQTEPRDGGVALRAAGQGIRRYRWVVFTSVNAVSRFMGVVRDARALGDTSVAAVGPATADALRAAGVEPDLVPEAHRASGLIAEFPEFIGLPDDEADSPPNLVLFPCAEEAPSHVPDALAEKGWEVRRVAAYRTVALPAPEGWLLDRMAAADAVIFTASSSARAYAALGGTDGAPLQIPPLVVCIGPSTAKDARALGMSGVEDADRPSSDSIVAVVVHHLAERS